MIDLSIIIVSWNVRELLRDCLISVQNESRGLDVEVIVVDSNSSDLSQALVKEEFPWVRLEEQAENVGFPRGNNIGLSLSRGRNILLLNPDTIVESGALERMVEFLDRNPDAGAIGPQLVNPDGSHQSSRRRFPSLLTAVFESTWLNSVAPKKVIAQYYVLDVPPDQQTDVDWLVGACIMVPARVVDEVGMLDEAYFMYSEELDWCRRIKNAGYRIVYLPDARVVHYMGKSSEQAVTERHLNFQRAKLRYFRKFQGRLSAMFLRIILLLNYAVQLLLELVKGIIGHKRPLRWQRARSYLSVLRSGLPPAGY